MCGLNLVDYDLQLVRVSDALVSSDVGGRLKLTSGGLPVSQASVMEQALFMSCVFELGNHSPARVTMALFFSLDIATGECAVIRALQQPRQANLSQLSRALARKYRDDVDSRVLQLHPDIETSVWTNAAVTQEQPLRRLANPRFPVTIVSLHDADR